MSEPLAVEVDRDVLAHMVKTLYEIAHTEHQSRECTVCKSLALSAYKRYMESRSPHSRAAQELERIILATNPHLSALEVAEIAGAIMSEAEATEASSVDPKWLRLHLLFKPDHG